MSTGGGLEADWPGHRGSTLGLANRQRCWLDLKRGHGPVRALGRDVVSRWKCSVPLLWQFTTSQRDIYFGFVVTIPAPGKGEAALPAHRHLHLEQDRIVAQNDD